MYDSYTGRFMQQDPDGFNAGDINLYRYVKNRPVDATDPSGLQGLQVGTWSFWNNARNVLDISNDGRAAARRKIGLLDAVYGLSNIPRLDPTVAGAPQVGAPITVPPQLTVTCLSDPVYNSPTPDCPLQVVGTGPNATPAQLARINIRVNLMRLKLDLVNKIYTMLSGNPPIVVVPGTANVNGRAPDTRVTTPAEWASAANAVADVYIRAVDNFLKIHFGARPSLGQRGSRIRGTDIDLTNQNEFNAPWCADWATSLAIALRDNPATNGGPQALVNAGHYQIRFRGEAEHNIVMLWPLGRQPQPYPAYNTAVLILDPWLDLMPRAYVPGTYSRMHVPTNSLGGVERVPQREPAKPD